MLLFTRCLASSVQCLVPFVPNVTINRLLNSQTNRLELQNGNDRSPDIFVRYSIPSCMDELCTLQQFRFRLSVDLT